MNDFTRDELEELLVTTKVAIIHNGEPYDCTLVNKIQSLIDNYCEHDWRENFSNVTAEDCLKCGISRIM